MPDLNNAVQLIRQGQKEAGQKILEAVIKEDPGNISAWFWYVETCPTVDRRIQVLEACLRVNPGNPQATQALQALKNIAPSPHTPPVARSDAPQPEDAYFKDPPPATHAYEYQSDTNAEAHSAYSAHSPAKPPAANQPKEYPLDYVDHSLLTKPKPPARTYAFYDVWMTVLLNTDIESYAQVLDDPEAGLGRAFEWMAYAGLATGLMIPLSLLINPQVAELAATPEFQEVFGNMGATTFIIGFTLAALIIAPLANVIGLAINAGLQNLLAVMFGGKGDFSRTAYAIAAYLAPMSILALAVSFIPIVGGCLGLPISIYNFILNIRALRAAHSLPTGTAIGVLLAPSFIFFILICLLAFGMASVIGATPPAGGGYY